MGHIVTFYDQQKKNSFTIEGGVCLGSSDSLVRRTQNKKPKGFEKLEQMVQIQGTPRFVHGHHAGVIASTPYAPTIFDLTTFYRTYLNGVPIDSNPRPFGEGDVIHLGPEYVLQVAKVETSPNHYAIIVGNNTDGDIPEVYRDLLGVAEELSHRGFKVGEILFDARATSSNLGRKLKEMQAGSTRGSRNIIYFAGHGTEEKVALHDGFLSADGLYETLTVTRGKTLVALDACHSGSFVDRHSDLFPANTAIVAAARRDEAAYDGVFTSHAFLEYFSRHPDTFDMLGFSTFLEEMGGEVGYDVFIQKPLLFSKLGTFTVPKRKNPLLEGSPFASMVPRKPNSRTAA